MIRFVLEYRQIIIATLIFIVSTLRFTNGQVDCGRRAPDPETLDDDAPPYGSSGWDDPQLAKRENFPWHVSIFRRPAKHLSFRYECGGTLIPGGEDEEVLVLTSAKCVTENLNSTTAERLMNFRIVVGPVSSNYNRNRNEEGSQKFAVRRIEINPLYEVKTHDANAAILQIDGKIKLGRYAYPACLPPKNTPKMGVKPGMVGEIAGFGWDTRRNVTESLRYAKYPLAQSIMCQDRLSLRVNDYLEFCAGYHKDATACQGDSGGGLVFRNPKIGGRYFVQGILSNLDISPVSEEGYCQNFNVFQRVGPYLDWIKSMQDKIANEQEVEPPHPILRPTPGGSLNYIPEFAKIARDFHNHYRRMHKAPPVRLVAKLQDEALKLAADLVEEDDIEVPKEFPYSANVFVIPRLVPAQEAVREAVQYWYRGFTKYDKSNPRPSAFSQMVWKSSTQIGVGVATDGKKTVVVVDYWPKGNILYPGTKVYERMKSFSENVSVIPKGY